MTAPPELEILDRPIERLAFNIDEAAMMLGVSVTTVRTLLATGRLGHTTAGQRVLISRRHLDEFLASPPERQVSRPGYRRRRR